MWFLSPISPSSGTGVQTACNFPSTTRGKAPAVIPLSLETASDLRQDGKMLAPSVRPHPSLRATFPLEGEGYCGGMVA